MHWVRHVSLVRCDEKHFRMAAMTREWTREKERQARTKDSMECENSRKWHNIFILLTKLTFDMVYCRHLFFLLYAILFSRSFILSVIFFFFVDSQTQTPYQLLLLANFLHRPIHTASYPFVSNQFPLDPFSVHTHTHNRVGWFAIRKINN